MNTLFLYSLFTLFFIVYAASATCIEKRCYRGGKPYFVRPGFGYFTCTNSSSASHVLNIIEVKCWDTSSNVDLNDTLENGRRSSYLVKNNSLVSKFSSNSMSEMAELNKLVLRNNSIQYLPAGVFDGLSMLRTLDLSFNKLEQIPFGVFDNLSTLITLELGNNNFKHLEKDWFSTLVNLERLYLKGNNLTVLPDDVFSSLKVLKLLDVSDNPLEQYPKSIFRSMFLRNTRLKKLNVNFTQSPLDDLDVSGSHLEIIDFDNFSSLKWLILPGNRINVIRNWNKIHSIKLILDHNNITEVTFPYGVQILDLSHNQISSLNNENMGSSNSINNLNLAFNEISLVQKGVFWNFLNLENLNLKHNSIAILKSNTFVNCSSLKTVDLSENIIQTIAPLAFQHVNSLSLLNLSWNRLTTVSTEMLDNVHQLKNLCLDHNEIVWFDASRFGNLKTLSMNNNSWTCEDLSDILHILKIGNVGVIDATSLDDDNIDGIACTFDKKS